MDKLHKLYTFLLCGGSNGVHGEDCERLRGTKHDRQSLMIHLVS